MPKNQSNTTDSACPRCGSMLHDEGVQLPSRVDRDHLICQMCDGLESMFLVRNPGVELPPIDQVVLEC